MNRIVSRLLAPLALCSTFAFAACDSDSSTTPTPAADTSTESDTTAPADDTTAPADDTTAPADDATAEPTTSACTNEADLAIIQNTSYDPVAKATDCGLANIALVLGGDLDGFTAATETCMKDGAYKGDARFAFVLSDDCGGCYVGSVRCTAQFCVAQCGTDPSSEACVTCRNDNGCVSGFYTCSGLPAPTPEPAQ